MASIVDIIKHLQSTIEKYPKEEHKVLKCFDKLYSLGVTVEHLQETGVGRTVNALRKEPGDVGAAARALVNKWKLMVAAEENSEPEDYNHDTSHYNGNGNGKDSDDSLNQSRNGGSRHTLSHSSSRSKSNEHRHTNGDNGSGKRRYPSSEEEPDTKKSRHHHQSNESKVKVKTEPKIESESDESDSEYSDSLESEVEVKKEKTSSPEVKKEKTSSPETYRSSSSKHSHTHEIKQEKDIKKEKESSSKRSHSTEHSKHKESRHSEDKSSKDRSSSSHKHKSSKESSSDEKHKSKHKPSDNEKSSSSKHSSSDKHKSSSHKSTNEDRHSSSKKSDKPDKHASQTHKEKHKSSSDKDKRDKSSSKDKHSEKEPKHKDSSKDKSSHSHKSEKHSSESKSKDRTKSDKDKSGESGSERESRKSSSHKSSKKSKEEPKNVSQTASEDSDDGIGCESGASFAEALGMMSPAKSVKKKTSKDMTSPNNSFMQDLGAATLLAPTAKLTPLPPLEISALPEISPNYKPRPPPKLLPHFTDEDAISAGISSKNQRTKVYSGNKMFGKIPSLYELCVHVLQEHIDALEFTGGVPYDILKPVVDRATPQQLFMLEHFNPYLMEDTDHLWKKFCEKHFRSMKRQEMESWREMYIRCQEEQEHKLKSLTANIKLTQEAKKAPIKQTKMAYVDSVVKPPRNIARKQAIHGTARTAAASPAARVAALSTSGVVRAGTVRPPPAPAVSLSTFNKPKKAPLMAKALQFMRGRKR